MGYGFLGKRRGDGQEWMGRETRVWGRRRRGDGRPNIERLAGGEEARSERERGRAARRRPWPSRTAEAKPRVLLFLFC